jgi:hypothetical protein
MGPLIRPAHGPFIASPSLSRPKSNQLAGCIIPGRTRLPADDRQTMSSITHRRMVIQALQGGQFSVGRSLLFHVVESLHHPLPTQPLVRHPFQKGPPPPLLPCVLTRRSTSAQDQGKRRRRGIIGSTLHKLKFKLYMLNRRTMLYSAIESMYPCIYRSRMPHRRKHGAAVDVTCDWSLLCLVILSCQPYSTSFCVKKK